MEADADDFKNKVKQKTDSVEINFRRAAAVIEMGSRLRIWRFYGKIAGSSSRFWDSAQGPARAAQQSAVLGFPG